MTGIDFIEVNKNKVSWNNKKNEYILSKRIPDELKAFFEKHDMDKCVLAYDNDAPTCFILAKEPKHVYTGKRINTCWVGRGFSRGSTNVLKDCPKDILILTAFD